MLCPLPGCPWGAPGTGGVTPGAPAHRHPPACMDQFSRCIPHVLGPKLRLRGGLEPRVQLVTSTVMSWGCGAAGTAASPPRVPAGRSRLPVFWKNSDLFFCLDFIFLFGFFIFLFFLSWLHRSPKGKADTSEYAGESFRAGVKQDVERFSRHNSALLERCRQDGDAHRCCGRNERN